MLNTSMDYLMTGQSTYSSLADDDREWLDLIHSLPPEVQRDFKGAMRIHAELHGLVEKEELRQVK